MTSEEHLARLWRTSHSLATRIQKIILTWVYWTFPVLKNKALKTTPIYLGTTYTQHSCRCTNKSKQRDSTQRCLDKRMTAPKQNIEILTRLYWFLLILIGSNYFKLRDITLTCDRRSWTYYTAKQFQQIETPDDGRMQPKHVVRRSRK
jgi:hypothetical protein